MTPIPPRRAHLNPDPRTHAHPDLEAYSTLPEVIPELEDTSVRRAPAYRFPSPDLRYNHTATMVEQPGWFRGIKSHVRRFWKVELAVLAAATCVGLAVGLTRNHGSSTPTHGPQTGANNGTTPWLYVQGNTLYQAPASWNGLGGIPHGTPWHGRGANIQDTRTCDVCSGELPVFEVQRRIDSLLQYNVNFMRLTLESDNAGAGILQDPDYFNDVREIVNYIGTKPQVYVEVSLWIDPTFSAMGWPTSQTQRELTALTQAFANSSHVLLGVCNEPKDNSNGVNDTLVWTAMNDAVTAIRQQEAVQNGPAHLVSVQGTRNYAGDISYYVNHPIAADGGHNVVYEVHAYDTEDVFQEQIFAPATTLPVIIAEFGPVSQINAGTQTLIDSITLMAQARAANVSHMAWNFHMNCGPNLLVNELSPDNPCGVDAPLELDPNWGQPWRDAMAIAWP